MSHLIRMPRATWKRQPLPTAMPDFHHPFFAGSYGVVVFGGRAIVKGKTDRLLGSGVRRLAVNKNGYAYGVLVGDAVRVVVADSPPALPFNVVGVPGSQESLIGSSVGLNDTYAGIVGLNVASMSIGSNGVGGPTTRRTISWSNPAADTFSIRASAIDASTWTLYQSGKSLSFTASGTAPSYSNIAPLTMGWPCSALNVYVTQYSNLVAISNTVISNALLRSVSENPWQLFTPAPSRFYLIPSSGGVLTLIVQSATHSHSVDAPSLTQAHVLVLADSLHGHAVESPILSQAYALTLAAAAHAHNADSLSLSQAQSLTLADTAHSHSADSIALTQAHVLALADTSHTHTAEAPTLSTGLSLSPADTAHSQTADTPALIQAHILSLSDATHSQTAESVSMGQGYTLTVADTAHSHTAEALTVTVAFVLAIQDALHSQAADALALATHVTLIVSDALHAHLAGSASEITLPTGDRIFLVANEDRLFLVASEDRLFGV